MNNLYYVINSALILIMLWKSDFIGKKLGTIRYILDFLLRNFMIALLFNFFCLILSLVDSSTL
jgi:hypothetical protein